MMPDLSPDAERIAQVIAAWNMRQSDGWKLCKKDSDLQLPLHTLGHLCIHQIRELAEWVQAELAKKEPTP